jgi:hypothetical protein
MTPSKCRVGCMEKPASLPACGLFYDRSANQSK